MWTPSSYLPRSAGPASSATCTEASPVPPGLQVLTDANLALPPFGTLGQNHQGKEQKEKESRRGEEGGGWKGSGKAQEGEQEGPITFFLTFGEITVLHMVVSELRLTWRRGLDLTTSHPSLDLSFCISRPIRPGLSHLGIRSGVCSSGTSRLSALLRSLSCQKGMKNFHVPPEEHKGQRHRTSDISEAISCNYEIISLRGKKNTAKCIFLKVLSIFKNGNEHHCSSFIQLVSSGFHSLSIISLAFLKLIKNVRKMLKLILKIIRHFKC